MSQDSDNFCSIYRIQLSSDFTFGDAERLLGYLGDLGITHLYLSPILDAYPGSRHFYDVYDYTKISEKLGGEAGFSSLVRAARENDIGIVMDIVPNHMTLLNPFVLDMLEKGRKSRYRGFFDIDFESPECDGKLILPLLGEYSWEKKPDIKIAGSGHAMIDFGVKIPVNIPEGVDANDSNTVLQNQNYILAPWKEANRMVNYRRFFAVNSLIGVRIEKQAVFREHHAKILQIFRKYGIEGIRIDHIDGLYEPGKYLERMRRALPGGRIYVEKILARDESLPAAWQTDGETGYSGQARITSLFIPRDKLKSFRNRFSEITGFSYDEKYIRNLKIEISRKLFYSDFERISRYIVLDLKRLGYTGISVKSIHEALEAVLSCFHVYRTYSSADQADVAEWHHAVDEALQSRNELHSEMQAIRLFIDACETDVKSRKVLMRIQQFTGAVMAKSMEDTFFYRYFPLLSMNSLGLSPDAEPYSDAEVHSYFHARMNAYPYSLNTLSTHDSKFGEDVRARFNALLCFEEEWFTVLAQFIDSNEIDAVDIYRILQVILGSFTDSHAYGKRLRDYIIKALRESGEHTSWDIPDHEYEKKCVDFAEDTLENATPEFSELMRNIAFYGTLNSLSQTILKIMMPGIPDTYQGSELSNLSLVDPDNRRPVDFDMLRDAMKFSKQEDISMEQEYLHSGHAKLNLTRRLLLLRRKLRSFLADSDYASLEFSGALRQSAFGFILSSPGGSVTVIISRMQRPLFSGLTYSPDKWEDTVISSELPEGPWRDVLSGSELLRSNRLSSILRDRPFSVFTAGGIYD